MSIPFLYDGRYVYKNHDTIIIGELINTRLHECEPSLKFSLFYFYQDHIIVGIMNSVEQKGI